MVGVGRDGGGKGRVSMRWWMSLDVKFLTCHSGLDGLIDLEGQTANGKAKHISYLSFSKSGMVASIPLRCDLKGN